MTQGRTFGIDATWVSCTSAAPGDTITVTLANIPTGTGYWLALVGAPNGSYLQWTYVGSGVTSRDWTVTMPSTEASYEFRLFLNHGCEEGHLIGEYFPGFGVATRDA